MNLTRGQAVSILYMMKFMARFILERSGKLDPSKRKLTVLDMTNEEERFINSMTKGN